MTTDIGAVDLDFARQRALGLLCADSLPQLVRQDKCGFVLHVQIAPELESRDAFDRVHEDGDRGEIVTDRQLPVGEDCPAGDAELVKAALTFPDAACGIGVNCGALTTWTEGRSAVVSEPDRHEPIMGFLVSHTKDGR